MFKRYLVVIAICICSLPVLAFSQVKKQDNVNVAKALTTPGQTQGIFSFLGLDPNRFSMHHSYTLSFGSIGGHGVSQGLYLNTMTYQLSDPITMYLQVGLLNQPFGGLNGNDGLNNELFISGAGFEYKPSKNFQVQFEYSQTPGSLSPYYRGNYNNLFYRTGFSTDEDEGNR